VEVIREIEIINRLGLHARAAARFVSTANGFESDIHLRRGPRTVNGKSIMGVMMLAAGRGTRLQLITEGPDAEEAADALCQLVENRFGEES
jgi:phosphocarrier protein